MALSRFEVLHEDEAQWIAQQRAASSGRILAIHRTGRIVIAPYVPAGWDLLVVKEKQNDISARTYGRPTGA